MEFSFEKYQFSLQNLFNANIRKFIHVLFGNNILLKIFKMKTYLTGTTLMRIRISTLPRSFATSTNGLLLIAHIHTKS